MYVVKPIPLYSSVKIRGNNNIYKIALIRQNGSNNWIYNLYDETDMKFVKDIYHDDIVVLSGETIT